MEKRFIITEEVALEVLNFLAKFPYYQSSEIIDKFRGGLLVFEDKELEGKISGKKLVETEPNYTLQGEPEFNREMVGEEEKG